MTILNGIFTSEAVAGGHPDKLCDQISDAVLDACLREDHRSRVAIETAVKDHAVCLLGEITSAASPDFEPIVRSVLEANGHGGARWGLDPDRLCLISNVSKQSPEISHGVGEANAGAGDQGIMFGFASDETPNLMPAPIEFANRLIRRHQALRETRHAARLGPDAKSQVSVRYVDGRPSHVCAVVLSTQHANDIDLEEVRKLVLGEIIEPELGEHLRKDTDLHINPAGTFHSGGPVADAGLTGRKIIADTYGGYARHGGGAFSGKDASKVDRSAAYAARQIARHAVERGWVRKCEIQIAYAIGHENPVSVDFVGESAADAGFLHSKFLQTGIDLTGILRPAEIIRRLDLSRPVFIRTSVGGHFGRPEFTWEQGL